MAFTALHRASNLHLNLHPNILICILISLYWLTAQADDEVMAEFELPEFDVWSNSMSQTVPDHSDHWLAVAN